MLDPKEQAKGGFRAQIAREQERQDVLMEASHDADGTVAPSAAPALTSMDGATPPADPPAPATGRQPKRWH